MKKLLLGMFTVLALNVQGQSFGEPQKFESYCNFVHFFVNEHYFYTTTTSSNGKDCTVDIYNDDLSSIKTFTIQDAKNQYVEDPQLGTVAHELIPVSIRNSGYDIQDDPEITQTLFNNDEKWEYVRGTFVYTEEEENNYKRKFYKLTKAEILNENGKSLATIPLEAISGREGSSQPEVWLYIVQMGENYYLYNETEDYKDGEYNSTSVFYKITKGNDDTGVIFTKTASFKSYPNPVRQNETFTIEVGEENVASDNFIELCDQSGRMVYRQTITNSEVKVPTRRMKGMYIYNIVSGGKAISTGKVIVQ